jgi:hypothetical protein
MDTFEEMKNERRKMVVRKTRVRKRNKRGEKR